MSRQLHGLVRSHVLVREVNERVRETVGALGAPVEFLCECSNEDCLETLALDLEEYETIRSHRNLFVVAGHEVLEVERVVDQGEGYVLLEKTVDVDTVEEADPRCGKRSGMARQERMIENQQTFRYANERLRERVADAGVTDHRHVPFFCECAGKDCLGRIDATLDEFEDAHLTENEYFILPGHRRIEGEVAIEENGRYEVVVKETV